MGKKANTLKDFKGKPVVKSLEQDDPSALNENGTLKKTMREGGIIAPLQTHIGSTYVGLGEGKNPNPPATNPEDVSAPQDDKLNEDENVDGDEDENESQGDDGSSANPPKDEDVGDGNEQEDEEKSNDPYLDTGIPFSLIEEGTFDKYIYKHELKSQEEINKYGYVYILANNESGDIKINQRSLITLQGFVGEFVVGYSTSILISIHDTRTNELKVVIPGNQYRVDNSQNRYEVVYTPRLVPHGSKMSVREIRTDFVFHVLPL